MSAEPSPCCPFSHHMLQVFQPDPWEVLPSCPPQLCHKLSHQQSPLGWPCHQIQCHCGAWVHGPCSCSRCGNVLEEALDFHRWFCPPGMFLAAFPLPIVSQLPGSSPHAASPATYPHLEVLCHICILISPLLAPKGLSHVSAVGGYSCPALCHTHPMELIPGIGKATLIPCPLPPSTCLYITPAPSQTLTSLHVCRFSLSCGCTQLETFHHGGSQSFTPSPPGSQRPLLRETWRSLDALLEPGGLGAGGCLWGRGAGGKDLERGASGCALLSILGPWAFCASPSPLAWCLSLTQPPCRQQTQFIPHQPLSYKSWVGLKHGQEVAKTPAQIST